MSHEVVPSAADGQMRDAALHVRTRLPMPLMRGDGRLAASHKLRLHFLETGSRLTRLES